jgi:hypothetical protein
MPDKLLDAITSDPVTMGWMQGAPPAPDKRLLAARADHMRFPTTRWAFSHMREFTPTARVAGAGGTPLPRAVDDDLDGVRFAPLGREGTITIGEALLEAFTDGVLVLHRGTVVFERWFGVTGPETRHIAFSMTKSFVGTLAEMLVEEGRLDPAAPALDYVPELAGSGFADATVRQIMDMTTAIDFSEDYADPSSGIGALSAALALTPRPPVTPAPRACPISCPPSARRASTARRSSIAPPTPMSWPGSSPGSRAGACMKRCRNACGGRWAYRATRTCCWTRWERRSPGRAQPAAGRPGAVREAIRTGGAGVIPPAVIARIRAGGDPAKFDLAGRYPELPGWSYRSQWWISRRTRLFLGAGHPWADVVDRPGGGDGDRTIRLAPRGREQRQRRRLAARLARACAGAETLKTLDSGSLYFSSVTRI